MFDFLVNLGHDVLFFLSDDVNELKALLTLERMRFEVPLHVELGFVPLVLSPPNIILNLFVVICLLLTGLFHLQL